MNDPPFFLFPHVISVCGIFVLLVYFNMRTTAVVEETKAELMDTYLKLNPEKVSMKALLVASIEMARRGGAEVKRIREQVSVKCNASRPLSTPNYRTNCIRNSLLREKHITLSFPGQWHW